MGDVDVTAAACASIALVMLEWAGMCGAVRWTVRILDEDRRGRGERWQLEKTSGPSMAANTCAL